MDFNDIKNLASGENLAGLKEKASALKEKAEDVAQTVAEKADQIGKSVNVDSVKSLAGKVGEGAKKFANAIDHFPGVTENRADDGAVNPELVKQDTKMLNNNPRNSDRQMP